MRFIPDNIRNSDALYRVQRAGALQVALVNDIFGSVRDEFTGYQHNAVGLLRAREGLSYQEAFDAVGAMADDEMAVFVRERAILEEHLSARGLLGDDYAAVMEHLERIAVSIRGQHSWHVTVEKQRYALDDLLDPELEEFRSYPDDLLAHQPPP